MTLVFSLFGGLLIAVAIQLVFANLGIALGLTVLDFGPSAKTAIAQTKTSERSETRSDSASPALPITHLLGFGVAIGFSAVIFMATLLSVEFSQLLEPRRGIIFGLFFWATYWLLFVWLSSTTISSIADSLLGTALEGGKQLLSTIKKAVQRPATQPSDEPVADESVTEQSLLQALVAEVSQMSEVQQELPVLLAEQREVLVAEICDRTDLSTTDAETLVQELAPDSTPVSTPEPTPAVTASISAPISAPVAAPISTSALMAQLDLPSWQQILRRTLSKVDLSDWDLETLWQQLPLEPEKVQHATARLAESAISVLPDALLPDDDAPDDDSADDDSANDDPSDDRSADERSQNGKSPDDRSPVLSPEIEEIQTKLIAYCRYTNIDSLTPEKLAEKVGALLEEHQLLDDKSVENIPLGPLPLDLSEIESVLSRRQNLKPTQKKKLIETLNLSWPTVERTQTLDTQVSDTDLSVQTVAQKAYRTIEDEFQSIDWSQASLEDIKPEVNLLLDQLEREGTLRSLDWSILTKRVRLPDTAKTEFTDWLKTAWISKAESLGTTAVDKAQTRSQQLADQITHFLHHQKKSDLEPTKMADRLTDIVSEAIAELPSPSDQLDKIDISTLSDWLDKDTWDQKLWDKDAWQQALENRKDLTAAEIQQILDWGDRIWQPKAQQISGWLQVVKSEVGEHLQLPDLHLSERLSDLDLPDLGLSDLGLSDLSLSDLSLPDLSLPDLSLPDLSLPDLSLPDGSKLAEARQQIVEHVVAAQEKVTERAIAFKEELQSQADAARRQVAIAAWWLFIALISSGSAAAAAGYLAAIY